MDDKALIEYLDEKFRNIDKRFDETKQDFVDLQSAVDGYAKKADDYFKEMVVLSHRVSRLEKWMEQMATKVGLRLEY